MSKKDSIEVHVSKAQSTKHEKSFISNSACEPSKKLSAESSTHTNKKTFICGICFKWFLESEHLNEHLRTLHPLDKPSACNTCSSFQCDSLKRHRHTFKKEKSFVCNICFTGFSQKCGLDTHLRIHTKEKPFVCNICFRGFSQKSSLNKHLRTHTGERPFVCELCHMGFALAHNLKNHLRIHTGERPFVCELCHQRFSRAHTLKRHLRIHTGEKDI